MKTEKTWDGKVIEKTWEVTVSLQRQIIMPVEENEDEEELRDWLRMPSGKEYILDSVLKHLKIVGSGKNTNIYVEEIELKEYEVSKYDTDPRV